ncbi:MAG: CzcE family metal-binding protein, partial [Burkholderiales bacterium]|nr:CzcE family metal-binding protein [Burkholderiales bacterium]
MSSIKSLSIVALLFGAYLATPAALAAAQAETFANGRSWYGVPNNPEVASRVVDVNSTDAINIECGETVTFRNGDKSFT